MSYVIVPCATGDDGSLGGRGESFRHDLVPLKAAASPDRHSGGPDCALSFPSLAPASGFPPASVSAEVGRDQEKLTGSTWVSVSLHHPHVWGFRLRVDSGRVVRKLLPALEGVLVDS